MTGIYYTEPLTQLEKQDSRESREIAAELNEALATIAVLKEVLERASFVALSVSVLTPTQGKMGEVYNKGVYMAAEAVYYTCRSALGNVE